MNKPFLIVSMYIDNFPNPEGLSKRDSTQVGYKQVGFIIGLPEETEYGDGKTELIDLLGESLEEFLRLYSPWESKFSPILTDKIANSRSSITEILLLPERLIRGKMINSIKVFDVLRSHYGDKIHLTMRMPRA